MLTSVMEDYLKAIYELQEIDQELVSTSEIASRLSIRAPTVTTMTKKLAGLVATVAVSVIGPLLPPITVPEHAATAANAMEIRLGYPPLLQSIAWTLGQQPHYADPTKAVSPAVIGGWVGMFVTFLNLLPVGQLDGGHILRAVLGDSHSPDISVTESG